MRQVARLLAGVLMLAIGGCVTPAPAPTMAPPSVDVRGNWVGTWSFENPAAGGGEVTLRLGQTGADVSGNATVTDRTGSRSTYFEGVVTGHTIILKPPYASGTLTVNGDEMNGLVQGIMPAPVTLRRRP
jgi:hypothetical protein